MPAKLKSRKLAIVILLILMPFALAFEGSIDWGMAIEKAIHVGMAYLGAQGLTDAAGHITPLLDSLNLKDK